MTPASRDRGRPSDPRGAAASRPGGRGPRRGLPTRRLAVLALLIVGLGVILTPSVKSYLDEKAKLAALEQRVQQQRDELEALEEERAAWDDPVYVERQARERLRFVKPGERTYIIVGKQTVEPVQPEDPATKQIAKPASQEAPWYGEMWQSVKIAAGTPRGTNQNPAGAPAPTAPTTPAAKTPTPASKATP